MPIRRRSVSHSSRSSKPVKRSLSPACNGALAVASESTYSFCWRTTQHFQGAQEPLISRGFSGAEFRCKGDAASLRRRARDIARSSVRKAKEGKTTNDLFAFLTTELNGLVAPIHPKAMPVILTTPEEVEAWMTVPANETLALQRPLPRSRSLRGAKRRTGRYFDRRTGLCLFLWPVCGNNDHLADSLAKLDIAPLRGFGFRLTE